MFRIVTTPRPRTGSFLHRSCLTDRSFPLLVPSTVSSQQRTTLLPAESRYPMKGSHAAPASLQFGDVKALRATSASHAGLPSLRRSSSEVVQRPQGGPDLDAWYRMFAPRVRAMILRFTGDEDFAEEMVQETFLRAHRYRHLFDPSRPAWPWLSKIAAHLCANELRRRRLIPIEPRAEVPREEHGDPEARFTGDGEALQELTVRHRRILVLRHLFGLHYREIARAEGISVRGVDSLLLRARRALRRAVARAAEEDRAVSYPVGYPERRRGTIHLGDPQRVRAPPREREVG